MLRAAAILRVVVFHVFGWGWLTIVLPSMGVMFALAGSLMATSMAAGGSRKAITSRLRRLLPPLWALAAIALPLMVATGWAVGPDALFWLLPLGDPPGSETGAPLWETLWYLRAYLWFVLLSPILNAAYRRAPWPTLLAPLALLPVLELTGFGLPGFGEAALWDFATYGACWIAGFAHADGRLFRLRLPAQLGLVALLGAAALAWFVTYPEKHGLDLNYVPTAQALWSLAFVLLVLRWRPTLDWLNRVPSLAGAIHLFNARAVTIYLWHNPAINTAAALLGALALTDTGLTMLATTLGLTALATVLFGWVEDLAARRPLTLLPRPKITRASPPARRHDGPVAAADRFS